MGRAHLIAFVYSDVEGQTFTEKGRPEGLRRAEQLT